MRWSARSPASPGRTSRSRSASSRASTARLFGKLDKAEVLVLDLALHDDREQAMLHRIVEEQRGRTAIIVTARDVNTATMRQLMRHGIDDCLPQPLVVHEVADAVTAARRKLRRQHGGERPAGKVIGVMRAKGGAGASTLAVNLAMHLRRPKRRREPPKRVCLIDLDLQFGDLANMLDLPAQGDLGEIIRTPQRLDGALLHTAALTHASGLQLLAAPVQPLPLDAMGADTAARLLELARDEFDYVVVDLPLGLASWTESVLVRLDQLLLVTQLNVPAVRQARRFLEMLKDEGLFGVPVAIVVNRHAWRFGQSGRLRQSEKALGRSFDLLISARTPSSPSRRPTEACRSRNSPSVAASTATSAELARGRAAAAGRPRGGGPGRDRLIERTGTSRG